MRTTLRTAALALLVVLLAAFSLEQCRLPGEPPATVTPSPTGEGEVPPTATQPGGEYPPPETATATPTQEAPDGTVTVTPTQEAPDGTVTPSPTPAEDAAELNITEPAEDDVVFSPVLVNGTVSQMPSESQLFATIYDEAGTVVGEGVIMATPDDDTDLTGSGTFSGTVPYSVTTVTSGIIEVRDSPTGPDAPTASMSDTVSVTLAPEGITIVEPEEGETVFTPVQVRGYVSTRPFEATLRGRVYDANGVVVGEGPVMVTPVDEDTIWGPGTFDATIPFTISVAGPGTIEVADISPRDGSVIVEDTVDVTLAIGPK